MVTTIVPALTAQAGGYGSTRAEACATCRGRPTRALTGGTGKYANIRLMAGDSQNGATTNPWMTAAAATAGGDCTGMQNGKDVPTCPLLDFCAACYYFAEAVTDGFRAAAATAPPLGMVCTAVGTFMY